MDPLIGKVGILADNESAEEEVGEELQEERILTAPDWMSNLISTGFAECGTAALSPRPEMRIVGGKNAAFGGWPWQVIKKIL